MDHVSGANWFCIKLNDKEANTLREAAKQFGVSEDQLIREAITYLVAVTLLEQV